VAAAQGSRGAGGRGPGLGAERVSAETPTRSEPEALCGSGAFWRGGRWPSAFPRRRRRAPNPEAFGAGSPAQWPMGRARFRGNATRSEPEALSERGFWRGGRWPSAFPRKRRRAQNPEAFGAGLSGAGPMGRARFRETRRARSLRLCRSGAFWRGADGPSAFPRKRDALGTLKLSERGFPAQGRWAERVSAETRRARSLRLCRSGAFWRGGRWPSAFPPNRRRAQNPEAFGAGLSGAGPMGRARFRGTPTRSEP
jgi:hypothetical protein